MTLLKAYSAPTELDRSLFSYSYKYLAPTELRASCLSYSINFPSQNSIQRLRESAQG